MDGKFVDFCTATALKGKLACKIDNSGEQIPTTKMSTYRYRFYGHSKETARSPKMSSYWGVDCRCHFRGYSEGNTLKWKQLALASHVPSPFLWQHRGNGSFFSSGFRAPFPSPLVLFFDGILGETAPKTKTQGVTLRFRICVFFSRLYREKMEGYFEPKIRSGGVVSWTIS